MQWNATLYDRQHAFVSKYGESLIELLHPKAGEKILDLGCGTGDLTRQIALAGCEVCGLDSSFEMIEGAKAKYPGITFVSDDACSFDLSDGATGFSGGFDAVFSNAVLHWIHNQDAVLDRVAAHLKPGGRFVAEMGGKGNVYRLLRTAGEVLKKHGYQDRGSSGIWFFPTIGEYASRLEQHGFDVCYAIMYDRPTELKDPDKGIVNWLEMFGAGLFEGVEVKDLPGIMIEIQERLRKDLFSDGYWYADYKRLRFVAVKEKNNI